MLPDPGRRDDRFRLTHDQIALPFADAKHTRAAEAAGTGAPSLVAFVHVPAVRRASSQSRQDLLTLDQLIDAGEAILRAAVGAAR